MFIRCPIDNNAYKHASPHVIVIRVTMDRRYVDGYEGGRADKSVKYGYPYYFRVRGLGLGRSLF